MLSLSSLWFYPFNYYSVTHIVPQDLKIKSQFVALRIGSIFSWSDFCLSVIQKNPIHPLLNGCLLLSLSGLLTVDPTQRLKVREVVNHEWLRGSTCLPHTPLMTPGILGKGHKRTFVESALNVTYDAFNRAHKEGFTLMDVQQAPLAKRRKKNKTTSTDSRSTTSSDHSNSGGTSPLLNPR